MPRGVYLHLDGDLRERFQCAPGPGGWRYVSERSDGLRIDLAVDARWRPARLEARTPRWLLRGGVTGADLIWLRAPADAVPLESPQTTEHTARAHTFLLESPGALVALARSLRLAVAGDERVRTVRLVEVSGDALSARTVSRRWTLAEITEHDTDLGPLPVERYQAVDLETGESTEVHIVGDVVLAAPGIELTDLESPPNL
jgi:hypothetical protein